MQRVEKQARDAFNSFRKDILKNKLPLAVNAEKFANYIAIKTNYTLKMVTVTMGEALRGLIVRKLDTTPKEADIIISDSNNECWSRFTIVKEACHLFLEHEKEIKCDNALIMAQSLMKHVEMTPNFLPSVQNDETEHSEVEKLLKKLLKEKLGYNSDNLIDDYLALNNPIGAEESSAVIAAIEILIPSINKDWINEQLKLDVTVDSLSNQLKVPKLILEYRLNQWFIEYNK